MTFGVWREILFVDCRLRGIVAEELKRKDLTQRSQREYAEGTETTRKNWELISLVEVSDFFVEVGESGFERLAVVGMSGGRKVVGNASPR